jgi:protein SCO1/2
VVIRVVRAFIVKHPYASAFVAGAVILTILPFAQKLFLTAPPPIASLGQWELVDEAGKPFGSVDLKGKVYIASFFFTRCSAACPEQQAGMKAMLPHLEDLDGKAGVAPIAFVSFTVDPDGDTPAVLDAYAARLGAPRGKWKFLTGSHALVEDLIVNRFHVAMGTSPKDHVAKLALVDQNGDLRGFWDTDELARGNLINAARLLAKLGPHP